ncbi:MAG: hypothetical protein A3D74_00650 [Candidatus Levybacteria bacterium RIFCSPHIGHO2_02_FULL_37_13]|nr:MAG: hypothetical protein A3D74_00650 [Candidatus Levybacteria bacterium RIFCSPHIGHO2_02_FULL_37_13]OGH37929.1 MAG: hypothetical protein A3B41_04945 [Candidatus Levybacteria bacterium RIFCSPLOWO2_01_FULL_37_26]
MKKLPLSEFLNIYGKVPRLCVEIVVEQRQGILLTLRDIPPGKGLWHFPGGSVLYDESVFDAAHRIAKEELGVEIHINKFLGFTDWYKSKNAVGHSVSLLFSAKITKGEIKTNFQAIEAKFFKTLPQNIMKENKKFIDKYKPLAAYQ